ncbi:protein-L-isoaspartate O-methyltransferase family protein [Nocardiopsis halotolerans]|uniref:protein-L-isoaspartate O-methyltransferase family protein n=1 Tax=Nocardiopsis halotolerans TaxID=124252 RepID=UPI00037F5903|nr:methyltransferase domain-containing protein [Nocardiopsis halotolerans]
MTQYSPRVTAALSAVDEDTYVLHPDGSLLTQTTARPLIASTLDGLDVQHGAKVLEIGTGSGYSSALLSELVGPSGTVVTVDVVPGLMERARDLHARFGRTNVTLLAGDGHEGAPDHGPYDRVVAWTTPERIPHAWVEQSRPGGLVVAPVELAGLVKTHAVVTAEVTEDHGVTGRALAPGGYVEMHGADLDQWTVPPRGVDALVHDGQGAAWWVAGAWAKKHPAEAGKLLTGLVDEQPQKVRVFEDSEDPAAFRAWMYATHPDELATLGGPMGFGVGAVDSVGVFVFRPFGPDALSSGATTAQTMARGWVEVWRRAGRPGWARVRPVLLRESSGWRVRAEESEPARS